MRCVSFLTLRLSRSRVSLAGHRYIEQFGFYEGGDANDYRIDPILLAAFLRGRADDRAVQVSRRRGVAALAPLEREVTSLEAQRATVRPTDLPLLEAAIARAREEVAQQQQALDRRLVKMQATFLP